MDAEESIKRGYRALGLGADGDVLAMFDRRGTRLTVIGRYRVRPRGSWEVLALPFTHVWYFASGPVHKVVSLLDGVELRRLAPARAGGGRG